MPFQPARVVLQDFTGVPAVVDLAAMRAAMARAGGDAARVDPLVPCDLVIDHSVQVDAFGSDLAYARNIDREYERNGERYQLLRWAQGAFDGFRVVPPGMGIVHQVNLEHLGRVVQLREDGRLAIPDTLVGTDSHTTMINGLGVFGFGVGGIEAEAVMLGEPLVLGAPHVIGVRFSGALRAGVTATDLVLTLTELLRHRGVVGSFVEFCGDGLSALSLADRATLSNMCPEFGATSALFPVDDETLRYLTATGRADAAELVERYAKAQGLFRRDGDAVPTFDDLLELDLASVEPSLAGPSRPQDRVALASVADSFHRVFGSRDIEVPVAVNGDSGETLHDGSVVIAAITSCTNTSNPSVMVAAALLARNAIRRGLRTKPWVKTSLAPGSRVVTDYLDAAGLTPYLDQLGFQLVGYGCTTCIGNSGPLPDAVSEGVRTGELAVAAVLSGNRNFEGRIHPQVRASYLASPPLVVAYALAGPRRHRPRRRSARHRPGRTAGLPARAVAAGGRDRGRHRAGAHARPVRPRVRTHLGRRRALACARRADRGAVRVRARLDLRARAAVPRAHRRAACAARPTSSTRAASRCSATRSPRTTSRRPARSRPTCPPGATSRSTGSSRASSTASARAAATTR